MIRPLDAIAIVEVATADCDFCAERELSPKAARLLICGEHFARLRQAIAAHNRSLEGPPAPARPIRMERQP